MRFPEPRTFRSATLPATLISWILGIGTIEYPAGRPRRAMSICWSFTCLIFFLNFIRISACTDVWNTKSVDMAGNFNGMILITSAIYGTTLIYFGQVKSKNLVDSLYKLHRVNGMLIKLGIPNKYGQIFKNQIIHIIGTLIFIFTMSMLAVMNIYHNILTGRMSASISQLYLAVITFLNDYTFSNYVRYIGKRFQLLNAYLAKANIIENNKNAKAFLQDFNLHSPWLQTTEIRMHVASRCVIAIDKHWMMHVLRTAKEIHHDLCSIAEIINASFDVQILLSVTMSFISVTNLLFRTYTLFMLPTEINSNVTIMIVCMLLWISFYALKVFCIISACSVASVEAQKTGERIHELSQPTTCYEMKEEIHAFALQLMQNPLQFTACGFFTLNYSTIRAMVGTVTTYLVIMIQMRDPTEVINNTANFTALAINTTV